MSLRDEIARAITEIPTTVDDGEVEGPEDEIVAAIQRQLGVLEGTFVVLGNMVQMLGMQIANLRAEVEALDASPLPEFAVEPTPSTEVVRAPSGATVEASLPESKRLPEWCDHPDALIVNTVEGQQRVCYDCTLEAARS